jgi:hypothetical protein
VVLEVLSSLQPSCCPKYQASSGGKSHGHGHFQLHLMVVTDKQTSISCSTKLSGGANASSLK